MFKSMCPISVCSYFLKIRRWSVPAQRLFNQIENKAIVYCPRLNPACKKIPRPKRLHLCAPHCNGNPIYALLFLELRGLSPYFHINVSVSDLHISRIGPHISCNRIGRSIVGIYKSLTDTWMWELGLWPRNSFSGNICFGYWFFAVLSLSVIICSKSGGWVGGLVDIRTDGM